MVASITLVAIVVHRIGQAALWLEDLRGMITQ